MAAMEEDWNPISLDLPSQRQFVRQTWLAHGFGSTRFLRNHRAFACGPLPYAALVHGKRAYILVPALQQKARSPPAVSLGVLGLQGAVKAQQTSLATENCSAWNRLAGFAGRVWVHCSLEFHGERLFNGRRVPFCRTARRLLSAGSLRSSSLGAFADPGDTSWHGSGFTLARQNSK